MRQIRSVTMQLWAHAASWNADQWIDALGFAGLFLFSFGVFYRPFRVHMGLFFMGLAFVLKARTFEKGMLRDNLLLLSIIFLLFLWVRTSYAAAEFKEYQPLIYAGALRSLQIGFFIAFLVAFWMHRAAGGWDWMILALLGGFIARVLQKLDGLNLAETFQALWSGAARAAFGSTSNRFGLWNAVILLACMVLHRQLWGPADRKWVHAARKVFWALMTVASLLGLAFSQSRSAWIGALLILPPAVMWKWYRRNKLRIRPKIMVAFLGGLFVLILLFANVFEQRILSSGNSYLEILSGEINIDEATGDVNIDSISQRVWFYKLFWEKWKARPWFGYGPGTSAMLIKNSSEAYAPIAIYTHFHDLGLDILIQLGIVGFLFYGALFYFLVQQLWRGKRCERIEFDYFVFVLGAMALVVMGCISGQLLGDYKGVYLVGFLGGMAYASKFTPKASPIP